MNNDVRQDASCCLFQFEGELRADHIEGLQDLVATHGDATPRHVLVDCHRVTRFAPGVLDALEAFRQHLTDTHGKLMVVGLGAAPFTPEPRLGPPIRPIASA